MKDVAAFLKAALRDYLWQEEERAGRQRAAVVLPLRPGAEDWELLFVVKGEDVGIHSRQVSFPGGKVEEGESERECALRELAEEVGLSAELWGRLSDQPTFVSSFLIAPFVGGVSSEKTLTMDTAELAEAFWVPLGHFYRPENQGVKNWIWEGVVRFSPCYFYEGHEIWGATARILGEFLQILAPLYEGE